MIELRLAYGVAVNRPVDLAGLSKKINIPVDRLLAKAVQLGLKESAREPVATTPSQPAIASPQPASTQRRSLAGRRPDLDNRYFRSRWEANYARYLNGQVARGAVAGWEYESKTFWFESIRRGTRSYTPDFKVLYRDRYEWHEVKGWMDPKSATRLKRMRRFYPDETIVLIDQRWFAAAVRGGLAGTIRHWERG